jgi:hypothetical protein
MTTVASLRALSGGMRPQLRASILRHRGRSFPDLWPMDPAGGMENAAHRPSDSIVPAGVSHTSLDGATRRPQAPQAQPICLNGKRRMIPAVQAAKEEES